MTDVQIVSQRFSTPVMCWPARNPSETSSDMGRKAKGVGKRTGVQVLSQDEEDMDKAFANIRDKENSTKRSTRSSAKPRFSLGDSADRDSTVGAATTRSRFSRESLSPSELSTVATAPSEDVEVARSAKEPYETPLAKDRLSTQEEPADIEEDVMPPPDTPDPPPKDPEEEEQSDDDMIPPPPIDDEESVVGDEEVPTQVGETPTQMHSDDGDDDDKEGPGFQVAPSPDAPVTPKETEKKVKQKKKREREVLEDSSDEEVKKPVKKLKKKKQKKTVTFSPKGIQTGPLTYKELTVNEVTPTNEDGPRRSRRTRIAPLEFWKNERPEYTANKFSDDMRDNGLNNMPVVKAFLKANETPRKPRKIPIQKAPVAPKNEEKFDADKLRKKGEYSRGKMAYVWDDCWDRADDLCVIGYRSDMESRELPKTLERKKNESKVRGEAAQAFNVQTDANPYYPGYIAGNLTLPPRGIKDAESVGSCAQVFTLVSCQNEAIEVSYGDPTMKNGALDDTSAQRFLLSAGDMFRVPPGNCYRIENHAKKTDAFLTWVILRPNQSQDVETISSTAGD